MNLTNDEIIDLMDCVNNRIDDLTDSVRLDSGQPEEAAAIGRLKTLMAKLGEELEAVSSEPDEPTGRDEGQKASSDRLRAAIEACRPKPSSN
jgi:hypothetical protein